MQAIPPEILSLVVQHNPRILTSVRTAQERGADLLVVFDGFAENSQLFHASVYYALSRGIVVTVASHEMARSLGIPQDVRDRQ